VYFVSLVTFPGSEINGRTKSEVSGGFVASLTVVSSECIPESHGRGSDKVEPTAMIPASQNYLTRGGFSESEMNSGSRFAMSLRFVNSLTGCQSQTTKSADVLASPRILSSRELWLSGNLFTEHGFVNSQTDGASGSGIESRSAISLTFGSFDAAYESNTIESDKLLPSHSVVASRRILSSRELSLSDNLFTEDGFVNSQIDGASGSDIQSCFDISLTFGSFDAAYESHTIESDKLLLSHSVVASRRILSSRELSLSDNLFTEHGCANSQIDDASGSDIQSRFAISLGHMNSLGGCQSQTTKSANMLASPRILSSRELSLSDNLFTEHGFANSQIDGAS
jgi:hypothetical protein